LFVPLVVAGVGGGAVISPNITMTLACVPPRMGGAAGGALQTGQRIGTAIGAAVLTAAYRLTAAGHGVPAAVSAAFTVALALTAVALVMAVRELRIRPDLEVADEPPKPPDDEHAHA
jgi:MFS family permease